MTAARDWFVSLGAPGAVRLFAVPHAGAGCAQLAPLAKALEPRGVELWSANLPGRQARLDEPPVTEYDTVVRTLADTVPTVVADGRPYALFGYCGGGLVAYGVVRELMARNLPAPVRLIVASYEAPDIARLPAPVLDLAPDRLWTYLLDSGGVPATLGGDERMRQLVEPAIRADFAVLAGYRNRPGPPLAVPITVYVGADDRDTRRGAVLGWRRQTTAPTEVREAPGGHWLLDDALEDLAAGIGAVLGGAA